MTHDSETFQYVEKRRTEHKTDREIRRCVKRYLAHRVFRILNSATGSRAVIFKLGETNVSLRGIAGIECNEYVSTHHGLDLSTGGGATVVAPTDIEITATGTNQYQGEYIIARMTEDPELVFQFHHCQSGSTQVNQGDTAAVETELCTEGDTGNAAGAHLHFQINEAAADDTQPTYEHSTDPEPILVEKGVL